MLLPKRRILELYANVIEMGRGIYGVEAASQHYFGVSARGLTRNQSAMLAAVLPNPKGWDPTKPSGKLRWRQQRILQRERNAHFPQKFDEFGVGLVVTVGIGALVAWRLPRKGEAPTRFAA